MSAKDQILTKPIKKAKPIALPVPQQQVEAPTYDPNVVKVDRPSQEETSVRNANLYHEWLENQDGLTDEERNKRDKSRAIRSILAAVGDGVSAIANLHGTTKYAPNMQMTSSLHSLQDRWDKEDKEGKEDARNKLSLYQQMQAAKRAEDEIKHRRDREKIADERYEEEKKYRAKKDAEAAAAQERAAEWAKEKLNIELEATNKRHEATLKNQRDIAQMANDRAIATAQANAAKGVRGKKLGFSDGDNNEVSIYENVWKPSMQQVYNAMIEDGVDKMGDGLDKAAFMVADTPSKIESLVKQYWTKSPKARAIMYSLSKIDPAAMTSEVEEEVEVWTPDSEEIEVWTPDKK
ncbi:MAG: hypothetical protein J6U49_02215 [Alistipes sp.]|nr:hypothetical protein [Alistipes sp.]